MRYILQRLGFYALAAFAVLGLNFIVPRVMPGDPASAMVSRFQGQMLPEAIQAQRAALGFTSEPLPVQYWQYITHALQGNLGTSISYFPSPVTTVIATGLLWTLLLAGLAAIVTFALGNILGVVGAWRRGGFVDSVLAPLLNFLGTLPYFFLAMTALVYLGFRLNWLPLRHAYTGSLAPSFNLRSIPDVLWHMALPAMCIALTSVGGWMLIMRNAMIGTLTQDYITMAVAKGLPQRRILFNYAVHNALVLNMRTFGVLLGCMLSGQLLAEIVFAYPGLGYILLQSIRARDHPLMQGLFLTITFAVLGANLIIDLLYAWFDPRVRRKEVRTMVKV